MATTLKVYFSLPSGKQEIRRFTTNERVVLPALISFLEQTYERHYSPPLRFVLQYDDGEDLCSISSEAELQEGLALHASSGAGGALKLMAAFDTSPVQQQSVEGVSGMSTPSMASPSMAAPSMALPSLSNLPASPSASAHQVAPVKEEASSEAEEVEVEVVSSEPSALSDSEYERVGEEDTEVKKPQPAAEASPKASAPAPAAAPTPVQVEDEEEADLANAVAASMAAPTVEEEAAPSPEVRIEDVSFSSVPSSEAPPLIHHGITCDGCGQSPLIGTRFNCVTCGPARGGYDLCQRCEEAGDRHPKEHQFKVHTTPMEREQQQCPFRASPHHAAQPPVDPMRVLQAAVQRVVGSLTQAAHAEESGEQGDAAQPIQVIQESVGEVLSAFRQAGEARRAAAKAAEEAAQAQSESASATKATGPVVHRGVTCDGCGMSPIEGARYKCKDCTAPGGFDLCSACEDAGFTKGEHTSSHVLIKFKQEAEGRGCWRRGGGGGWHGRHGGFHGHGPFGLHPHPHGPFGMGGPLGAMGPLGGMLGDIFGGRGGRGGHGMWGGRGRCMREQRPRAQFISDVTLADGLSVHAGEVLRKVWSVKNVGTAPWPVGTRLVFVGGDLAPESEGLWGPDSTGALVPYAGPGDVVHVSIDVLVPNEPGRFRCTFRLQTAEGDRFGPRVWIDLKVPDESAEAKKKAEEPQPPKKAAPSPAVASPSASANATVVPTIRTLRAIEQGEEIRVNYQNSPRARSISPARRSISPAARSPSPVAALPVALPVQQVRAAESKRDEEAKLAAEFRAAAQVSQPSPAAPKAAGASSSPAPPAPSTPAPTSGRPPFQYANELAYLSAMGFTDSALCKYLLLNNQGDLTKAVQWLLQNAKSQ